MTNSAVTYVVEGEIAVVTLNDPDHRNALSRSIREGLREAFARLDADADVRVGVLTGAGDRAFCAGANLKEMSMEAVGVPPKGYVPIVGRDVHLDKVLIAAVNGTALGGGFLLAQMADLVVAAENAVFGMPEVRVGRGAPWSVPMSRMVPQRVWMELCLLGEPITAQRAYEVGLVNAVVPVQEVMPRAMKMATTIASNAPLTVRASRQMVHLAGEMGRSAAWDVADALFEEVYRSADAQEGPTAFRDRRTPRWQGK